MLVALNELGTENTNMYLNVHKSLFIVLFSITALFPGGCSKSREGDSLLSVSADANLTYVDAQPASNSTSKCVTDSTLRYRLYYRWLDGSSVDNFFDAMQSMHQPKPGPYIVSEVFFLFCFRVWSSLTRWVVFWWTFLVHFFSRKLNPLSAKPSFQLWYPGGQRLKVISFSWSGVKSPSKCFSNTEPTTIIASRDKKRCNASVQWTRSVHSTLKYASVINTGNVTDDCFSSLSPRCSAAWPSCSCTSTSTKTAKCETVATSGLGNRLLKTRWFVDNEGLSLRTITRWLPCVLFSSWTMDHRTQLVPIAMAIDGPSALDLANARKSSFHSGFRRTVIFPIVRTLNST